MTHIHTRGMVGYSTRNDLLTTFKLSQMAQKCSKNVQKTCVGKLRHEAFERMSNYEHTIGTEKLRMAFRNFSNFSKNDPQSYRGYGRIFYQK